MRVLATTLIVGLLLTAAVAARTIPLGPDVDIICIYRCGVCGGAFISDIVSDKTFDMVGNYYLTTTCAVHHAPGTCCHFEEPTVTKETLEKIRTLLE